MKPFAYKNSLASSENMVPCSLWVPLLHPLNCNWNLRIFGRIFWNATWWCVLAEFHGWQNCSPLIFMCPLFDIPFLCHLTKNSMPYKLSGKTKFSMASCILYNASFFCETASQHNQKAFLSSIFVSKDYLVYSIYMHINSWIETCNSLAGPWNIQV